MHPAVRREFPHADEPRGYLPDILPFIVALVGAALALVTAWLGGELVFRLRVAVDDDAGLDPSNSLARGGAVEVTT